MLAARFLLQMVLGIVLPLAWQRWDKARLPPEDRERAWNGASWGSALYNFGELSMLGWYWVTRRWRPGALLGIPTSLVLFVTVRWAVDGAVAELTGGKPEMSLFQVIALWGIAVIVFALLWALTLLVEAIGARRGDAGERIDGAAHPSDAEARPRAISRARSAARPTSPR